VISAASAQHGASAKALILGLSDRQKATGKPAYFIHTSGTSILGDQPVTGRRIHTDVYSDKSDIYSYEKNHPDTYNQRVTDVSVVDTGEAEGVKTYIIIPPTIHGRGTGLFNTLSNQVPNLTRLAIKKGQAAVIGEGKGIWNHVHVVDLSVLYLLLLRAVVARQPDLPYGKKGIYFAESGEHTKLFLSEAIGKALKAQGTIKTDKVESITIEEAAEKLGMTPLRVELSLASNSRSRADLGRELLGWKPKYGNDSFAEHFTDEVAVVSKEFE